MTKDQLANDRIRFNWGFHDGSFEAERKRARDVSGHYSKVYAAGYVLGVESFNEQGKRLETSDAAWEQYRASIVSK